MEIGRRAAPSPAKRFDVDDMAAAPRTLRDHLAGNRSPSLFADPGRAADRRRAGRRPRRGRLPARRPRRDRRPAGRSALREVERCWRSARPSSPSGCLPATSPNAWPCSLRARDRFDPAMQRAARQSRPPGRARFRGAEPHAAASTSEDLLDMMAEIRALTRGPGAAFGGGPAPRSSCPDVFVRAGPSAAGSVELNADILPRVLVDQHLLRHGLAARPATEQEKTFSPTAWPDRQLADRSLDQRAKTILKVATEIVRQQDGFLVHGVEHLRPLNLKTVADAIGMHESTVSRVTSNKYMATPRGVFELKYLLHHRDRLVGRRRGPFGRSRAAPHQAADRRRKRPAMCFRTTPSSICCRGAGRRYRPAHRRQVPRGHEHPLLGHPPAAEALERGANGAGADRRAQPPLRLCRGRDECSSGCNPPCTRGIETGAKAGLAHCPMRRAASKLRAGTGRRESGGNFAAPHNRVKRMP